MSQHPALVILAALAALATVLTFVFTFVVNGRDGPGVDSDVVNGPNGPDADFHFGICDDPRLSLSDGSGPSGTQIVVSGSGFPGDRNVELRFHTEALAPARTDDEGSFEADVRIPGTYDPFAPRQFDIVATANVCSQRAPFQLEP
jgi:hypothetical protein